MKAACQTSQLRKLPASIAMSGLLLLSTPLLAEEVDPNYPVAPMESVDQVQPLESDTPDYVNPYAGTRETTPAPVTPSATSSTTDDEYTPIFVDQSNSTATMTTLDTSSSTAATGIIAEQDAPSGYYAQIGAFSNAENALRLKSKQAQPAIVVMSETNAKSFYKVQVGPFENWQGAFAVINPLGGKTIYVQH
ncbi:MAG: SPOR domain-containing protein [bacterium]